VVAIEKQTVPNSLDVATGLAALRGVFTTLFAKGMQMIIARITQWGAVAAAALVMTQFSPAAVRAQALGYNLGVGLGWAQQPLRLSSPREDLPFFAKFPPVYYGDMVRRPYGFSPYALPPGIEPIEQKVIQQTMGPRSIVNPFFERTRSFSVPAPALPLEPAPSLIEPTTDEAPRSVLSSDIAT